ncbi:MAG: hypothetical protein Q8M31_00145 [Beijerinckiaceae bacterium]|nr:hypothetical protein [Beijerinckiaceae bacterium]
MTISDMRTRPTILFVIAMSVIGAVMLAAPAETVTTKYVNDLFVFLDGAWRIAQGQIPNRDFHSAMGPMVYVIPAVGYWLSGSMGAAMPWGMSLFILALSPVMAWTLASRLRPAIAAPFALYLILVLAAPANFGESVAELSFAMFYNRIGWVGLGLLLVYYLPPLQASRRQRLLDVICATLLITLLAYTKITYAAFAAAFVAFLFVASPRRWDAFVIGCAVLLVCAGVEAVWRGSASHVADLLEAARVSGNVSDVERYLSILMLNLADLTAYGVFAALIIWRTGRLRDLFFLAFCAGAGFLLIVQNFQHRGLVTLAAGAVVAAELVARRDRDKAEWRPGALVGGVHLLLLGFLLPTIVHTFGTLATHTTLALTKRGEPAPLPGFSGIRLATVGPKDHQAGFRLYFQNLHDGAEALRVLGADAQRTLVLDFVNPFSAGLGLRPPLGDNTWHHWGRTINEASFPPAERLFNDVHAVLVPKRPIEFWTSDGMRRLYAAYLAEHFIYMGETSDWRLYLARPPQTLDASARSPSDGG